MARFAVAGLINIETTLRIDGFPLDYAPVRYPFFGVNSSVSGVGYNLSKALVRLGHEVSFMSLVGRDQRAVMVHAALAEDGVPGDHALAQLEQTPQSVILYDGEGRRAIHVDLKDVQDQAYPPDVAERLLGACDVAALCNVNFTRPLLRQARALGKLVATDVHTIADLHDAYNRDYMAAADILFMSDEKLPCSPPEWARRVLDEFPNVQIVGIGMGRHGALLAVRRDNYLATLPAVATRPIVSTIGAGDALFVAFLHGYAERRDPYEAMRKAMLFASYKIGVASAADGFLSAPELDRLYGERSRG
ncbi:MAG: carbohydrate kinase family protein [Anaerolineae bacterium]|nr:carbohydrate kinase family protein [Anaerolineae bacterium]